MTTAEKLVLAAETDVTFQRQGPNWVGKCLICNGPIAFDALTGEGATLEHIRARGRGGTDDVRNLAAVHGRCNWEKGRRWDPRRRRSNDDYEALVDRLLLRRLERWREVVRPQGQNPDRQSSHAFLALEFSNQLGRTSSMGKGDKRTRRGKIFKGSFGKSRPKKKNESKPAPEQSS